MTDLRPEEVADARDELKAAVAAFFERTEPGTYVHAWVVVAQTEGLGQSQSVVSQVVSEGQPGALTRGMLEIAIEIGTKKRTFS